MVLTPNSKLVREKFLRCLPVLREFIDFKINAASDGYFVGAGDYDPITADDFLDEFCAAFSSLEMRVYYLDIDAPKVARVQILASEASDGEKAALRMQHAGLFDATIEGSYFLIGPDQSWALFYDALEDMFLLHVSDKDRSREFSDFLLP